MYAQYKNELWQNGPNVCAHLWLLGQHNTTHTHRHARARWCGTVTLIVTQCNLHDQQKSYMLVCARWLFIVPPDTRSVHTCKSISNMRVSAYVNSISRIYNYIHILAYIQYTCIYIWLNPDDAFLLVVVAGVIRGFTSAYGIHGMRSHYRNSYCIEHSWVRMRRTLAQQQRSTQTDKNVLRNTHNATILF